MRGADKLLGATLYDYKNHVLIYDRLSVVTLESSSTPSYLMLRVTEMQQSASSPSIHRFFFL